VKQTQIVAFDEHMTSAGLTVTMNSSEQDAIVMGMFDQIGFTVTAEQVTGSNPALKVQLWHSADGINWLPKRETPEITSQILMADGTNTYVGYDDGTKPTLRYVRFMLTIETLVAGFDAAVRIDAVLNDSRENAFAAKMHKAVEENKDANQCSYSIQGGDTTSQDAVMTAYSGAVWQQATLHGTSPLFQELSCDDNGCTLAADASICVKPDGSVNLQSPRSNFNIPPAAQQGGDC
jgi:hypothetical protein